MKQPTVTLTCEIHHTYTGIQIHIDTRHIPFFVDSERRSSPFHKDVMCSLHKCLLIVPVPPAVANSVNIDEHRLPNTPTNETLLCIGVNINVSISLCSILSIHSPKEHQHCNTENGLDIPRSESGSEPKSTTTTTTWMEAFFCQSSEQWRDESTSPNHSSAQSRLSNLGRVH